MKYALLIHSNEEARAAAPPEVLDGIAKAYDAYSQELTDAGVIRGGEELEPSAAATTIRGADGSTVTTDGPFAESKEQLGGFFIIEVANLDEAIAWAQKDPSVQAGGSVEVRPIHDM